LKIGERSSQIVAAEDESSNSPIQRIAEDSKPASSARVRGSVPVVLDRPERARSRGIKCKKRVHLSWRKKANNTVEQNEEEKKPWGHGANPKTKVPLFSGRSGNRWTIREKKLRLVGTLDNP
jgi:hypothetical protein